MKFKHKIKKEDSMNVDGVIYGSEEIIKKALEDGTIEQIKNVAKMPGIIGESIAMADAHKGYGFCIGGVGAFDLETGVISPGGVGYDINCGVRMLSSNLNVDQIRDKADDLIRELNKKIPSGVGRGSPFQLSKKDLDEVLENGAKWLVDKGYGNLDDLKFCEENGCIKKNSAKLVSDRAKKRGIGQLGTLGAGNHFLEVQYVEEIFDEDLAKRFGIKKGSVTVMIHCGSRGLGHQVASDYIKKIEDIYGADSFENRDLIYAPIKSAVGKEYFMAMNSAANFAFANRHLIGAWTKDVFGKIFENSELNLIYDVCHNIAKIEKHKMKNGEIKKVCVHRKGATRSFGPGREEIPEEYRDIGQPVILPGSMGTSSYLLVGREGAEAKTFGSCAHGAGRAISRSGAVKKLDGKKIKKQLEKMGIKTNSPSEKSLMEEAPCAYKNVDLVVESVANENIAKKVARLKPIIVIKG